MLRYAITDRHRTGHTEPVMQAALIEQVKRLAAQGVDYVQLREKDLPFDETAALALRLLEAIVSVHGKTRVVLNAPWPAPTTDQAPDAAGDVVGASWPEGVGMHLSSASLRSLHAASLQAEPLARDHGCRPILPQPVNVLPRPVSAACHSVAEAEAACAWVDLLLFAPVFEKWVDGRRVQQGTGLSLLAEVCRAVHPLPVLAMGGVTPLDAAACMDAGAAGIAGIRLFL